MRREIRPGVWLDRDDLVPLVSVTPDGKVHVQVQGKPPAFVIVNGKRYVPEDE